MQFHILSFEGPDPYSRTGGLATRVDGMARTLSALGFETHLWFIGDPAGPGEERLGSRHLHPAVLANSGHEPFGLVGLETMAADGLACTGCTGEDYVVPGQNALVLEAGHPGELLGLYRRLRERPEDGHAIRRAGRCAARRFAWREIVERVLLPRAEFAAFAGRAPAGIDGMRGATR